MTHGLCPQSTLPAPFSCRVSRSDARRERRRGECPQGHPCHMRGAPGLLAAIWLAEEGWAADYYRDHRAQRTSVNMTDDLGGCTAIFANVSGRSGICDGGQCKGCIEALDRVASSCLLARCGDASAYHLIAKFKRLRYEILGSQCPLTSTFLEIEQTSCGRV